MQELRRQGVHVPAPCQFTALSPSAFHWKAAWALGFPPVPAFPLKKAELWSPKGPADLDAIHEARPATQVSQDSNLIAAGVSRDKATGHAAAGRPLTAARTPCGMSSLMTGTGRSRIRNSAPRDQRPAGCSRHAHVSGAPSHRRPPIPGRLDHMRHHPWSRLQRPPDRAPGHRNTRGLRRDPQARPVGRLASTGHHQDRLFTQRVQTP